MTKHKWNSWLWTQQIQPLSLSWVNYRASIINPLCAEWYWRKRNIITNGAPGFLMCELWGDILLTLYMLNFLYGNIKKIYLHFLSSWQHWGTVDSLWLSDAIWQHRSGSVLAQVMAYCLTAPSHYLNQCWLVVSEVRWQSFEGNLTQDTSVTNYWTELENWLSKFSFKSPRDNEFKHPFLSFIYNTMAADVPEPSASGISLLQHL